MLNIDYSNASLHDYLTARDDNGSPVDAEISAFTEVTSTPY